MVHLKERNTSIRTQVIAVNTNNTKYSFVFIRSQQQVLIGCGFFTATAVTSFVGTCLMALLSNYPHSAPSLGLNAYFAHTVVLGMGYSWQIALAAVS